MDTLKNPSETFPLSLLKDAIDYGIISVDSVLGTLMSTKREKIKKNLLMQLLRHPNMAAAGRPATKGRMESVKISRHKQKRNYWIS